MLYWVSISILWVFSFHSVNEVWGLWLLSVLSGSLFCQASYHTLQLGLQTWRRLPEPLRVRTCCPWEGVMAGRLQLPVPLGSVCHVEPDACSQLCYSQGSPHVVNEPARGLKAQTLTLSGMVVLTGSVSFLLCSFLPGWPDFLLGLHHSVTFSSAQSCFFALPLVSSTSWTSNSVSVSALENLTCDVASFGSKVLKNIFCLNFCFLNWFRVHRETGVPFPDSLKIQPWNNSV